MSGIAGLVRAGGPDVDRVVLGKMAGPLAFRGPDGGGTWVEGGAGFTYSLMGASASRQDALVARGPRAIVADARIDARDDLLNRFDGASRDALRTATCADLILSSYERWGAGSLEYLTGDFSFAIWDGSRRSLLCARDQFGVKPLFYASTRDSFLFSNTLKCLTEHPGIDLDLDRLAIADFLLFGQSQEPSATAFANLRRLPAGHSLEWHDGVVKIRRYWTLPFGEAIRFGRDKEYIEGFRHHLERAVSDRLHPHSTSILMSGGLDSTMVAAAASRRQRDVKSYAVVHDRLIPDSERHFAQIAADAMRIPLQCHAADDYPLFLPEPGAPRTTAEPEDEPVPGAFAGHLAQVQAHSPVALSGLGGDQLLFPSPNFAMGLLRSGQLGELAGALWQFVRLRRRIPAVGFRSGMLRGLGQIRRTQSDLPPWLSPDLVKDLSLAERWRLFSQPAAGSCHPTRPEAYGQLTDPAWAHIFESYDAGVTTTPVDVRHPLFDMRLVNYCLGVPPIPWCVDKTLARAAMQGILPDAIRLRPKSFAADAVAARLAASPWVDRWEPLPELAQFVEHSRIPALATTGSSWDPHHRPFLLNQWLFRLTPKCTE